MTERMIEATARFAVQDEPGQAIRLILYVESTNTTATLSLSPVAALVLANKLIAAATHRLD